MKLELSESDLRPIVRTVMDEMREEIEAAQARLNGRLAYTGPEAAALCGVAPHALRDARLRGEIVGTKLGKKICYERTELLKFLERNRQT